MRTIETKVYTFEELSEEAKERAIESNRQVNVEYREWYESVFDIFKGKHSDLFEITNIYFSGFWSQGDGAMFEYGGVTDKLIDEFIAQLKFSPLRKKIVKDIFYFSGSGKHSGHYYHERSCRHSVNVDHNYIVSMGHYPNIDELMDDLQIMFEAFIEERYIDLAQELYSMLDADYKWLISDEEIKETLIVNEYEFTELGERL